MRIVNSFNPIIVSMFLCSTVAFATEPTLQEGLRLKDDHQLADAARVFQALSERNPTDTRVLEQLATVEGWLSRYDDSAATWRKLLQIRADYPGARVGLARVLYWKGSRSEAIQMLDQQLQAHPDDFDAHVLKGDVLMANEQTVEARTEYETAHALSGHESDVDLEKKLSAAPGPYLWRLDTGGAVDHYTNARGTEESAYAQLGYTLSSTTTLYLHYDWMHDFGTVDQSVIAGAYWHPTADWLFNGEIGATPDAHFRPSEQLTWNTEYLGNKPLQPLLGLRYAYYDTSPISAALTGVTAGTSKGGVTTVTPGLRILVDDIGNFETRYGLTHNIDGSNTGVYQLRFNSIPLGALTPYLAFYHGKEALPPQPEATFTVYSAGGVYSFTDHFGIRLDLAYEHRPVYYNHTIGALGFSFRF
jgi:YaiO family outer membrane protein